MTQQRLNNLFLLYVQHKRTLDLSSVVKAFVSAILELLNMVYIKLVMQISLVPPKLLYSSHFVY